MARLKNTIKYTVSFFSAINRSLNSTRKSFSTTNSTINNIRNNINNSTKIKNELFMNSKNIQRKREESSKRKEMEDILEASKVSSTTSSALGFARNSNEPIFSRLLSTLGFITAGWIVENIPTWAFIGKEFIRRLNKVTTSISSLTDNVSLISKSFNNLLSDSFIAIATFDFRQFTEGSVASSFTQLSSNLSEFGNKLSEAFGIFNIPLTQSLDGTQRAPELGESRTRSLFQEPPAPGGSSSQTRASYGTKEQRAMLDAIAWAEGGVSYRTMFGGGQFDTSGGWKHPDTVVRSGGYASAAAGRYQFMPFTWDRVAKALGLRDFSPINQDRAAIFLIDEKLNGNSAEILKRQGVTNFVMDALSREWAAVPMARGGSYHRQRAVRVAEFKEKYNLFLNTNPIQEPQQSTQSGSLPPLPPTNTYPNQYYGAPRSNGRRHSGVDFDIDGPNAKFYSRIGGVVVGNPFRFGADGWAIDIYNERLGVYERIAEANLILVKPGQVINPGDLVAQGESGTGVIHYEIRTKREGEFENSLDPIAFLEKNKNRISTQSRGPVEKPRAPIDLLSIFGLTPSSPSSSSSSRAQITPAPLPPPTPRLTPPPERASSDLMMFIPSGDTSSPPTTVSSPTQVSSPAISEFRILNSFIKNKILLDLAYL